MKPTAREMERQSNAQIAKEPDNLYWVANKIAAETLISAGMESAEYLTQYSSGTTLWMLDGKRFMVNVDGNILF